MAPTNIQLPNNTDSIDFVIYNKFESATPGQLVANAYWGSITQALVFGIILLAGSQYYWKFAGKDGWVRPVLVSILLALSIGDFAHHQYASYDAISVTNPVTGHGIQEAYYTYWQAAFMKAFFVVAIQPFTLAFFSWKAYGLWNNSIWVAIGLGILDVGAFVMGIFASTFAYTQVITEYWVDEKLDLVKMLRNTDKIQNRIDRAYSYMSAWLVVGAVADAAIAAMIIAAMYKHRRQASGMRNMENVRNTLRRGMLYVVESMSLVLAGQVAHSVILIMNLGMSRCMRAVMATRVSFHAWAVIWSLNSRASLKEILLDPKSSGTNPISFDSSGALSYTKRSNSRSQQSREQDSKVQPNIEMTPYDSTRRLIRTGTHEDDDAKLEAGFARVSDQTRSYPQLPTQTYGSVFDEYSLDRRLSHKQKNTQRLGLGSQTQAIY